mmetsp:Transcript_65500/g.140128  ORF Transcript_65500/g.140128 Transcript_65500/m.140128 type:complete len:325 (-) Transcript_65500:58-1032(-)
MLDMHAIMEAPIGASDAPADSASSPSGCSSPLDSALLKRRRARAFRASASTQDAQEEKEARTRRLGELLAEGDCGSVASAGGLSQAELDALSVEEPSEAIYEVKAVGLSQDVLDSLAVAGPDCDEVEQEGAEDAAREISQEDLLLRVRRMRAFLGSNAAMEFSKQALAKVGAALGAFDAQGEDQMTGNTSSTRSSPRAYSQEALDALSVRFQDNEGAGDQSSDDEDRLLYIRRTRAFVGSAEADVLSEKFWSEAANASASSWSEVSVKRQPQLDRLFLEAPMEDCDEDCDEQCRSPLEQVATPQRKGRPLGRHMTGFSPEHGGA